MRKDIRDAIIKIASEEHSTDCSCYSDTELWRFVKLHPYSYKTLFGGLYSEEGWSKNLTLSVKQFCPDCEMGLLKLQSFLDDRPQKYDNTITLTFHQDFLSAVWHIHGVEFGTYEPFSGK